MFDVVQILSNMIKQGFQTEKCLVIKQCVWFGQGLKKRTTQAHNKEVDWVWLSGEFIGNNGCDINGKDYIDSLSLEMKLSACKKVCKNNWNSGFLKN